MAEAIHDAGDIRSCVVFAYRRCLLREPDKKGFEHYKSLILAGRLSLTSLDDVLVSSEEGRDLRASGNAQAHVSRVTRYYEQLAGRVPSRALVEHFSALLDCGKLAEEDLARLFATVPLHKSRTDRRAAPGRKSTGVSRSGRNERTVRCSLRDPQCLNLLKQTPLGRWENLAFRKPRPNQLRVLFVGEVGIHGLARLTKLTVRGLVEAGVYVRFYPSRYFSYAPVAADDDDQLLAALAARPADEPYDVLVVQTVPDLWANIVKDAKARAAGPVRTYGIAIWETDTVPEHWPEALRVVDVVSTLSEFNRKAIQAAVPDRPVVTIYGPVAPSSDAAGADRCAPVAPPGCTELREEDYVFYTINEWNNRKGIAELLEAFHAEFTGRDKVSLYVKTDGDVNETEGRAFLQRLAGRFPDPPRVLLVYATLSSAEIAAIHRRGNCYVSLTKAEGIGYGLCEAALCGKPIISGSFGAQTEYLKGCTFLGYSLEPANYCSRFAAHHRGCGSRCRVASVYDPARQKWGVPDQAEARAAMREAYATQPSEGNPLTKKYIEENFQPRAIGKKYEASIRETCLAPSPVRVRYVGPYNTTGYGRAAIVCVRALARAPDAVVHFRPVDVDPVAAAPDIDALVAAGDPDFDVLVLHYIPCAWPHWVRTNQGGARNRASFRVYGMVCWETDRVPSIWIEGLRCADVVSVPSEFNRQVFQKALPHQSVVTVPYPVEPLPVPLATTACLPAGRIGDPEIEHDDYVFYTINEWTARKGLDDLITVFHQCFSHKDRVALYIKTSGLQEAVGRRFLASVRSRFSCPPKVILNFNKMSLEEIGALHRRGDCYVSLTRTEGLGYGLCEAVLARNPVVVNSFGAHCEYLRGCLMVRHAVAPAYHKLPYDTNHNDKTRSGVPACHGCRLYSAEHSWGQADLEHAAELLRDAYRKKLRGPQSEAITHLQTNFSSEVVGELLYESLATLYVGA